MRDASKEKRLRVRRNGFARGRAMGDQRGLERFGGALLALCFVLPAATGEGNSIQVTPDAALGGSRFGLEITLDDPARVPSTSAWVAVGPDKGLEDETAVSGSFLIDPADVTMSEDGARNHIEVLSFFQDLGPSGIRIAFFLQRGRGGRWLLGAWVRDDAEGRLVLAGRGTLAAGPAEAPGPDSGNRRQRRRAATRIDFEWVAASAPDAADGHLRVFRTEPGGEKAFLFERTGLDNGTQTLNHLRVGVVNRQHHFSGTSGRLYLDDFVLSRVAPAEQAGQDATKVAQ